MTRATSRMRSNPAPITGESDWRKVYTRRRMPSYRRRRWVRFKRRVDHVIQKKVAPKFNVFVRAETATSIVDQQNASVLHTVLGGNGTSEHTDDIADLVTLAQAVAPAEVTVPSTNLDAWRIQVTGWMIETSITNNSEYPVYIDMYYWRIKRDVPSSIGNIYDLWAESLSDMSRNFGAGINQLVAGAYGVTPFQGTQFAKNAQVWRKQRVKLAGGGTTQVEQRSGKNHTFDYGFVEHYSMLRRATEGILMVFYGSPGFYNGGEDFAEIARPASLSITTNVNYTWRIILSGRLSGAITYND